MSALIMRFASIAYVIVALAFAHQHVALGFSQKVNINRNTGFFRAPQTSAFVSKNHAFKKNFPHSSTYDASTVLRETFHTMVHSRELLVETSQEAPVNKSWNSSMVEFVSSEESMPKAVVESNELDDDEPSDAVHPFVTMMRGSAGIIAEQRDSTAVFHLPGEAIDNEHFSGLLDDIALCWLFGLKIVLVVSARFEHDICKIDSPQEDESDDSPHEDESDDSLRVMSHEEIRKLQVEEGYLRCEVERRLNRRLRVHGMITPETEHSPAANGNVVSGNFYTSKPIGVIHDVDYQSTGLPEQIHVDNIINAHERNDIVLLTTIGTSTKGEPISTDGNHLAAHVAASLEASKLVYFSKDSSYLRHKETENHLQELPLSHTQSIVEHNNIKIHKEGFENFEEARQVLKPSSVEMLLHLGWSNWALENGVTRAHIVGFNDGALLEELYSSHYGANTCIYHDDQDQDEGTPQDDWELIFPSSLVPSKDEYQPFS